MVSLLEHALAPDPPDFGPAVFGAGAARCQGCGLAGGGPEDYRYVRPAGPLLCAVCGLARQAAWEPERVRLAVIPELSQAALNALVVTLTVNLLRARSGAPPRGIDARLQERLLEELQHRAEVTRLQLPWAASAALLRHVLLAQPPEARAATRRSLAGLRYLPEPADPPLAAFFHRRARLG